MVEAIYFRAITYLSLFIFLTIFLLGCMEEKEDDYEKMRSEFIDASLIKVSLPVAIMDANLRVNKNHYCTLDNVFPNHKYRCSLLTVADNATRPTLSQIRAGKVPAKIYSFTALFPDNSDEGKQIFRALEIGPFDNLIECRRVELIARIYNIPVEACKTCLTSYAEIGDKQIARKK